MSVSHLPHALPSHMCSLFVSFHNSAWDPLRACALLYTIAHTQHRLQTLDLTFEDVTDIRLACQAYLPMLRKCSLRFTLTKDMVLDLSWLQHQPCNQLSVSIYVCTELARPHQHVTDQLLQLPLHRLSVSSSRESPPPLQVMWKRLAIPDFVVLSLSSPGAALWPLQAFPCCPDIVINATQAQSLVLDWAAVTSHAARFSFHMGAVALSIIGGCHVPIHLQGAWQLTIHSAQTVQGLQGAHVHDHADGVIGLTQVLPNSAAVAAGWKVRGAKELSKFYA